MAKATTTAVLDKLLDEVATATRMTVCSAQPTTFAEANATYALADVTMSISDFSKSTVNTADRQLTVAAKPDVLIDTSGTATHVALVRVADSTLLYVTTCMSQALTANGSNKVNFPSWTITVAQPT